MPLERMDGCFAILRPFTVFQSYQDDCRMIMKGCVPWNPVYERKDFLSSS